MKVHPTNNQSVLYNIGLLSNYLLLSMLGMNLLFVIYGLIQDFRLNYIRKKNYYLEKARIEKLIKDLKGEKDEKKDEV